MEKFTKQKKILIGFLNASIVASIGVMFALYNPADSLNSGTTPDSVFTNEVNALSHVHHTKSPSHANPPDVTADQNAASAESANVAGVPTTLVAAASTTATSNDAGSALMSAGQSSSYYSTGAYSSSSQSAPSSGSAPAPQPPAPRPAQTSGAVQRVSQTVYQAPATLGTTVANVVHALPSVQLSL